MIKIVFPEVGNPIIAEAITKVDSIAPLKASSLEEACQMLARGEADTMIGGVDYTSRDIILACRDIVGMTGETFSGAFLMKRGIGGDRDSNNRNGGENERVSEDTPESNSRMEQYIVADAAACKEPTVEQLCEIICQTYETAKTLLDVEPRVAILSFSTLGSGGHSETLDKCRLALERVRVERPEIIIDGEMQLDAAVNREVGRKKAPNSPVAGSANVLIMPDLNSGNILYKAMEQFGGFVAAGPILQGFKLPVSDLSRGSTVEDIVEVIKAMKKLVEASDAQNNKKGVASE